MNTGDDALGACLAQALRMRDPVLGLRAEESADQDFVSGLYAQTRWEELMPLAWPDEAKHAFLRQQCALQRQHYRSHYPRAHYWIVMRGAQPIGRIYVQAGREEIRLMEIALLAAERGQGIGQALVTALQRLAEQGARSVTLHVEPDNPAQRLYARLGFVMDERRGVYDFLRWTAATAAS